MHVQGALTGIRDRDEFLQYHVIRQCGKFQDGRKEGRKKCFI